MLHHDRLGKAREAMSKYSFDTASLYPVIADHSERGLSMFLAPFPQKMLTQGS